MMKIAFVTPEFITEQATYDGGLANYLYRISLALISQGHQPYVFVGSDKEEVLDFEGIKVYRVIPESEDLFSKFKGLLVGQKPGLASMWLQMGKTLNNRVKEVNEVEHFDIVQHSSYGAMGYFRPQNIPSITRLSSYEPLFRAARGITAPSADEVQVELNEKQALKRADAIFGPSKLTAQAVEKDLGLSVKIIETPFILETKELDNSFYNDNLKGKKYLLYWGTVSRLKGVRVIVEMLPQLLEENKDLNFVFIGKPEPGILEHIQEIGSDRVLHYNRLPHEQLFPVIQNAYAIVLPSLYDNFPNTCIEAMAFGKVVVGTRGASFDQLITDGESGFLCKLGDASDLARVVNKVLTLSEKEIQNIGSAAQKRIELLRPEVIVKQVVQFYEESIKEFNKS
ncbi:MAG: glycosyltransferase family 4 protein [Candidatus Doudnabacteria bacterium]|nr:glycosyltransferase family 4 protein [Candidatus Doudnabacteria bacterium]